MDVFPNRWPSDDQDLPGTNLYPDFPVEQQFEPRSRSISELQRELRLQRELKRLRKSNLQLLRQLQCLRVDETYNEELCCLFNMFHNHKINAKKLGTALKSLEEKYYYPGTDHRRFIHCGDVAGTSLSQLEGAGSSGYPSTSGYPPGTNACGRGVPVGIGLVNNSGDPSSSVKHSPPGKGKAPHEEGAGNPSTSGYPPGTHASGGEVPVGIGLVDNNGDPSSSVKHSPPGKGKVPHEEGAGGFADVSRDAIGSMNASREGDLEMGLVNSNANPLALGDVRSSVVHHVDHIAAGSGVYGENVAMTIFQVATAAYGTATSKFAQASHTSSLATSMAAFLLADTNWKAATPILTKAGSVVCGVGVLADIGKDLPLPLFLVAISTALLIIIVAILCAKRPM